MKKHLLHILSALLIINLLVLCSCTSANDKAVSTKDETPTKEALIGTSNSSDNSDIEVSFDSYLYGADETATATITNHSTKNTYTFGEDFELMIFNDQTGDYDLVAKSAVHNDLLYILKPQTSTTLTFVTSEKFPDVRTQSDKLYFYALTFTDENNDKHQVYVQINFS